MAPSGSLPPDDLERSAAGGEEPAAAPAKPREKRSQRALRAALEAADSAAKGKPLAAALSNAMRAEPNLGPHEKRAAAAAARGILRQLRPIDLAVRLACEAAGLDPKSIADCDRVLVRYLGLRVTVEGETPERSLLELKLPGPRRPRTIDDRTLERIALALPALAELPRPEDPVRAMALVRSVPDHLAQRLAAEVGVERADAVLEALNRPARLDLRVNRLRGDRERVERWLAGRGVETERCRYSPDGLIAKDRAHLFGPTHAEGFFEAQDEGSQLIALAGAPAEGELAIDFCAGSGGKSLALAASVGPKGQVVAVDAITRRLAELPQRARRARAQAIVRAAGAEPPEELLGKADLVLVDAPCSGVGSLRREVDLRWRLTPVELDGFLGRQLPILQSAARFVRPGGRLVYATCSPFRAENEGVVEAFLREAPGFEVRAADLHPDVLDGPFLRYWPDRHGGGAFFGAVLVPRR